MGTNNCPSSSSNSSSFNSNSSNGTKSDSENSLGSPLSLESIRSRTSSITTTGSGIGMDPLLKPHCSVNSLLSPNKTNLRLIKQQQQTTKTNENIVVVEKITTNNKNIMDYCFSNNNQELSIDKNMDYNQDIDGIGMRPDLERVFYKIFL